MNCRQCRELLDNLLVAQGDEATRAELRAHLEHCSDCAREHAVAEQVLASLTLSRDFRASPDLRERIMNAISEVAVEDVRQVQRGFATEKILRWGLTVTAAAAIVLAAVYLLNRGSGPGPGVRFSALGLLAKACAAE